MRKQMVNDVMRRVLPGKTREQIEEVLGPSLQTFYFQSLGRDLIYYLGPERGTIFGVDGEWLLIWFDGAGRYHRAKILSD